MKFCFCCCALTLLIFCPVGCLSLAFLNWDSQQGRELPTSGRNKKIIHTNLLVEVWYISSNLNSKQLRFHGAHRRHYILSFLTNLLQKWPQCTVKSAKISFIVQQPLRETLVCLCRNRKFSKGHKYLPLWALAKLVWASRIADDVANFFLEPSLDQEVYTIQTPGIFLSSHVNLNISF